MRKLGYLMMLIVVAGLYACSPSIPFTNEDKIKYNLTEERIKKLQFFVSRDMKLRNLIKMVN